MNAILKRKWKRFNIFGVSVYMRNTIDQAHGETQLNSGRTQPFGTGVLPICRELGHTIMSHW